MTGRPRLSQVKQLKIDKDIHVDRTWIMDYVRAIKAICKLNRIRVTSIRMCHSARKGQHYYVDIRPPLRVESANRLQWLLGDDCRRVDYNRARIRSAYPDWNKLFERIGQRYTTLYRIKVPAGTRKTPKEVDARSIMVQGVLAYSSELRRVQTAQNFQATGEYNKLMERAAGVKI